MNQNNQIQEIRRLLKNINTDDEIDEIHDILDRMDGSQLLQHPEIAEVVGKIVKKGIVTNIEVNNHISTARQAGGGSISYYDGPIEATIIVQASPEDVYDD